VSGNEQSVEAWLFNFVLESSDGRLVYLSEAEEVLDEIIRIVESRKLQIGGGYRALDSEGNVV